MLIDTAFAQDMASNAPAGASVLFSYLPFVVVFILFYFLLLRPQTKRANDLKNMRDNLRRGDQVVTAGGLVGQVSKVIDEHYLLVEVADGVKVRVVRESVEVLIDKGAPAATAPATKQKKAS